MSEAAIAPRRVTQIFPRTLIEADLATAEGRAWISDIYREAPENRVRLNMITSLTGSAVGADGTSETLTSRVDRAILGVIRSAADVVLVGASTVRAEGYLVPRTAALAIVTASGRLTGHRLTAASGRAGRILLICPMRRAAAVEREAHAAGIDAEIVGVAGGDDLEPRAVLDALDARGMPRVVCEGGPTLATRFVRAGAVDELCVTVAPVLSAAKAPFVSVVDDASSALQGMLVDDAGFSYLRLQPSR